MGVAGISLLYFVLLARGNEPGAQVSSRVRVPSLFFSRDVYTGDGAVHLGMLEDWQIALSVFFAARAY